MSDQRETRRESLAFEAVDPATGKRIAVQLSYEKLKALPKLGLGRVKEAGFVVPLVLQRPTAVFEDFLSDADEPRRGVGWRCYCGKPGIAFDADGKQTVPRNGFVFLVFVTDENVAYNWRWEKAHPQNDDVPEDHATRFKRNLL